jgi:glycosyltransferase involved in cell wall biosynthesis
MKIAILTRDSAPFGELIRTRAIEAGLRGEGHHVEVLTMDRWKALRSVEATFFPFAAAKLSLLVQTFGVPTANQMIKAWINCILNAFYLIPVLRKRGCQVLLAETHTSGLCAWLMKPHVGFRLYMDFHGTAEEIAAKQAFYREALRLEGLLLRSCDVAISCSGMMRDHLVGTHAAGLENHLVCHNGTELRSTVAHHRLPIRAVYAGQFDYYQRVMDFVDAARINTDPEIEFYLMGGGGENQDEILDYISKRNIKIIWVGYKPREATLKVFSTMQVGVSPATKDMARQVASPLKILDYAACGLPVVTVAAGEWSEVFRQYDAGAVCNRCDPETLLEAIRALKDECRWNVASRNAQRLVRETRTWPAVLAPLYEHFRSLEASPLSPPHLRPKSDARTAEERSAELMVPR